MPSSLYSSLSSNIIIIGINCRQSRLTSEFFSLWVLRLSGSRLFQFNLEDFINFFFFFFPYIESPFSFFFKFLFKFIARFLFHLNSHSIQPKLNEIKFLLFSCCCLHEKKRKKKFFDFYESVYFWHKSKPKEGNDCVKCDTDTFFISSVRSYVYEPYFILLFFSIFNMNFFFA